MKLLKTCYGLTDGPSAWFKHIVRYLTQELGYRQSIVDPCLFFLDSPGSEHAGQSAPPSQRQIEGILALATDDLLHGGSELHLQKMEQLRKKYVLGKFTWGAGRFVGKQFTPMAVGSIRVDQEFYTKSRVQEIPLSRDRKRRRFSRCNDVEIEQLRALLAWLAKETRVDLAGQVALVQQAFPRPMVKDIIRANGIARVALENADLGIKAMPIPLDRLRAGVITDAAWGHSREFGKFLEESSDDFWEETPTSWIRHHTNNDSIPPRCSSRWSRPSLLEGITSYPLRRW